MIFSDPEEWADAIAELEEIRKSGRLRGLAFVFHKTAEEVTEDSIYRTATMGYAEPMDLLRQNMNTAAALKQCGIPISTTKN